MRKLITTIALLALVHTSVAIAQTAGSRNPAAHRSTNSGQQLLPGDAPVGHRQPRADQVPSEKNLMDLCRIHRVANVLGVSAVDNTRRAPIAARVAGVGMAPQAQEMAP